MMKSQKITVNTASHDYLIHITQGLISDSEQLYQALQPYIKGKQVLVVTNDVIAPLYLGQLKQALAQRYQVVVCELPDGEQFKNQNSINKIYDQLMDNHFNRDATLIALGGGVIGDMAGFAAASFMRGVNFIQIPTTLLSQVDSSVGGKTGINHALGKNMIGAFWQPRHVLADMQTLSTLPAREFSAGMAEVIKYAFIMDVPFLTWIEANIDAIMALEYHVLSYIVKRCCELKAQIVAEDERESGKRAILNFGHTFGHVIETHQGYGNWLHGEAVAAGMVQAAKLSHLQGWLSEGDVKRITNITQQLNLPIIPPKIEVQTALELMYHDKKTMSGNIRLVLLKSIGDAVVTKDFSQDKLVEVLKYQ